MGPLAVGAGGGVLRVFPLSTFGCDVVAATESTDEWGTAVIPCMEKFLAAIALRGFPIFSLGFYLHGKTADRFYVKYRFDMRS